jgi:hypothetical protein
MEGKEEKIRKDRKFMTQRREMWKSEEEVEERKTKRKMILTETVSCARQDEQRQ